MARHRILPVWLSLCLLISLTGCWSSKEIEDLSMYIGVALDEGKPTAVEQNLDKEGVGYLKRNLMTATIQIVPTRSSGSGNQQTKSQQAPQFFNVTGTGDSLLEIMREFSLQLDRPAIGHHLKVIVVSTALAQNHSIENIMDFILRDNDIRPSCMVFLSHGSAKDTIETGQNGDIPAFKLKDMPRGHFRTGKVMKGINLTKLDELLSIKRSFILQEISGNNGLTEAAGAGIIKGETGSWIGSLNQTDVESIAWITNQIEGGTIKSYDWHNKPVTYEIKKAKRKITARVKGDDISFQVDIQSEGRLIENWDLDENPSSSGYNDKAEKIFKKRLSDMLGSVMTKLQSTYHTDVIGFRDVLRIQHPKTWKKLEDRWDEVFSRTPVTFNIKLKITDYGSSKK
ncbi:Ger(x)C family spore germination protein [Paenibacillus sp. HN-1]|uniref:Ger(x)C family spore germination protein n=1 Tax=Paenibacillus TaxID=44249 RepID=UPI001CA98242|nr:MULTISPECIES: Ger(x)C family spore germination protein [Paenibacillus]MBY9081793.1 Ger(x)C family spore germination protein [Paenibacillus sp. CGMCC 1.18879]MBY9086512.1 Ger(x)C family spore germination protein [Paenibacillus sinensis]